ncbi:MAG: hypothetical protein ABMA64_40585 [Myxococcota bacterium]
MDRQFWLGFAAYLVPTFPLGYLWHLVWFHAWYERLEAYRPDVVIPMGLGSMILQGALFSWAFPRLFVAPGRSWASTAALAFAGCGLLAWSFVVLPVAAKHRMTSVSAFVEIETAFTALQFAIYAPLAAWVYGRPAR